MRRALTVCLLIALSALVVGCSSVPAPGPAASPAVTAAVPNAQSPSDRANFKATGRLPAAQSLNYEAAGPFPIDLADVAAGVFDPNNKLDTTYRGSGRIDSMVSDQEMARQREEAMSLPPSDNIQAVGPMLNKSISAGVSFEAITFTECCGGGGSVPPDPELAVGPNHIIAVTNVAFEIYDKTGTVLVQATTFSSFFAGTTGCTSAGVFDPNALYDESTDRFILGIDGDGTDYCIAATTGSDPTATWNRYGFATDIGGNFFDFPHVGVGLDAIYMGSNQFGQVSFAEARVFAIDKAALYAGAASLSVVSQSTGGDGTPQPAHLHGFNTGTWPTGGPHYIMTEVFDGNNHSVWSWTDPFGANVLTKLGNVNLTAATGVTAGQSIDWPQAGSSELLQGNDFRGQSTTWRNGNLWMSTSMSCNPGGGTVNCVRWAQIDPTGPTILDAGVIASNGDYRTFPNVSANHCDDMAIGYTKGSSSTFPSVFVSLREAADPPGTVQGELLMKAGEVNYTSFQSPGPHRWGDYTKMTSDPDGVTFWYIGEYSRNNGATVGDPDTMWATFIGSFTTSSCSVVPTVCGNGVIEGNEVCDGGDLGGESCTSQSCSGGGILTCNASCDGFDTASCFDCPICDFDSICELGEDCNNCSDCPSGTTSGAACGNGVCEAGNGENCLTCAADCNGKQGGKPSNRYCCGDGGGTNPVPCSDSRCTSGGVSCTTIPTVPGSFCCGDLSCDIGESCANCALDCAAGAELCDNGIDDDCNGDIDCADISCLGDPVCDMGSCFDVGASCVVNGDCCSNKCKGPNGGKTCK